MYYVQTDENNIAIAVVTGPGSFGIPFETEEEAMQHLGMEYLPDDDLWIGETDYDPEDGKYVKRFRGVQMKNFLLTDMEFFQAGNTQDPTLQFVTFLLQNRNGYVDVEHELFEQAMNAMYDAGIIDDNRRTELMKGLPVEYANLT